MKIPFKVDLTGKTAIVTGGSGTLCSAMAYGLAVSGAKVAIIGRNRISLIMSQMSLLTMLRQNTAKTLLLRGIAVM